MTGQSGVRFQSKHTVVSQLSAHHSLCRTKNAPSSVGGMSPLHTGIEFRAVRWQEKDFSPSLAAAFFKLGVIR